MNRTIYPQIAEAIRAHCPAVLLREFAEGAISDRLLSDGDPLYREALTAGAPVLREGCALEPFFPVARLIVLGGGHVALPLVSFAAAAGFAVTVVDDRPSFASAARVPTADRVLCEDFNRAFDKLSIASADYVAIITRGHRHDIDCLSRIFLGAEPFYTGMIGSRRRVAAVRDSLVEQGFSPERLARLHAPIGLPIGAATPAEIAVSILSEMIREKRLGGGISSKSDLDARVIDILATEGDVPKAVATVLSTKGSTPRGAGAKMLIYPDGRIEGSIGGGCAEGDVITIARDLIGARRHQMHRVDMTNDAAEDEGMVCGGSMDVLIEDF